VNIQANNNSIYAVAIFAHSWAALEFTSGLLCFSSKRQMPLT